MSKETYEDRIARRQREEIAALDNPIAQRQAELDFHWQARRDAAAAMQADREWINVGGYRERRRSTCHRSNRDPDWDLW